ncbi:MAG: DUF4193 family protein [Actinomycetota bacterium]
MEDIEDEIDDEDLDEVEPQNLDVDEPAPTPAGDGEDVESIEDLLVKKEAREEEEDEDSILSLSREERLEPLAVKVVPPQPTEFICKKCYLVKHRSQLKDKGRMLCRDCA